MRTMLAAFALLFLPLAGAQAQAPTLTVTRTPAVFVAGQPYTVSWASTNTTSIAFSCTSTGSGFAGGGSLPANGSDGWVAIQAWVGNPSTCTWIASGPGGSRTLVETMRTISADIGPGADAGYVAMDVPAQMVAGQPYNVSVSMQNNGKVPWTAATAFKLGSQSERDNTTWGNSRVELPPGASVAPGQQYTFRFTVIAPVTPGNYPFQWQMLRESVAWLGAPSPIATVAVGAAPRTTASAPPKQASRSSAFEYDPASGLLTRATIEPDMPTLRVDTDYVYDQYGNAIGTTLSSPASGKDAFAARGTNSTYDARGQFAVAAANALGHRTASIMDAHFGLPLAVTDANGLTTTWEYDSFGRKKRERRADGSSTVWDYDYCRGTLGGMVVCPANASWFVQTRQFDVSGSQWNGPWRRTYFDALGREVGAETLGFDGNTVIRSLTEYDSLGRVYRSSRPFLDGQSPQWTVHAWDELGRLSARTGPDGATLNFYRSANEVATRNALGQTEKKNYNSQGQLIRVTDSSGAVLAFDYDAFGNLWRTTDHKGNAVVAGYDARGRKVQSVDPDLGSWTYTYNAIGELVAQTDAKGQLTSYAYDALGRMVRRSEADLVSMWTYDSCAKGIGKLCAAAADNGYARRHAYDALGRPVSVRVSIDADYSASVSYDENGRVATRSYPGGLQLVYGYTALGFLREVRRASDNVQLWRADSMDAEGHLLQQTFGNGVVTSQSYASTTGRLLGIQAGAGNLVQALAYTYDAIGNLVLRTDANQRLSETFLYDSLNRMTSATVNAATAGIRNFTAAYDPIGNIAFRSDGGNFSYGEGAARPHAISALVWPRGSRRFSYDANGNMISDSTSDASGSGIVTGALGIRYTSFNMPAALSSAAGAASFVYDSEHQRIRQTTRSGTTIYLHPDNFGGLLFEKEMRPDGSVELRHFLSAGGQVFAILKQQGSTTSLRYLHRDHLGSLTTVTDESGKVVERQAYEAFGKRRTAEGDVEPNATNTLRSATTARGFTNHEHLDDFGLVHMNGRLYSPALGRFLSADPFVSAPENLQSYNRYSYVWNNPLAYTDPSGYSPWSSFRDRWAKPVAAIVAAYYVGEWVGSAVYASTAQAAAASATAAGGELTAAQVSGMWRTAQIAGGVARGFTGSMIVSGGNLRDGFDGAVAGGISSSVGAFYGADYPSARIAANTMVGGIQSEIRGNSFKQGAKFSFAISAFAYLNTVIRNQMIEQSKLDKDNDGTGLSNGMFGDGFKLAGGRWDPNAPSSVIQCSSLGCLQKGPGSVFGIPYGKGSFVDMVTESFAGPHDKANSYWFYDAKGLIKSLDPGASHFFDLTTNYTTSLLFATPFAAAAISEQLDYSAWRRR